MSRFNTPTRGRATGPVTSTGRQGRTHEGAAGFGRDTKSELFLAAVSFMNENTFYETAEQRLERIRPLVQDIAPRDVDWLIGLVRWLRVTAGLRSVGIAVAADGVAARLASSQYGKNRDLVSAAILRPDEVGEFLGYWTATYGRRQIPSAVKRALGDALNQMTERGWLKWRGKGERGGYSMVDVLNLVHAKPEGPRQEALFKAAVAHSYGRPIGEDALTLLPMTNARESFLAMSAVNQRAMLADREFVKRAGITHEVAAGALGKLEGRDFDNLIDTMGFQAMLMNLRRMDEAGISARTRGIIRERLRDVGTVRGSGMMPIRFLSAYRNAPLDYAGDLQVAMNHTLSNVPSLPGHTLILIDRSGSMQAQLSAKGTLSRVDAANIFGTALALRAESADLVAFGTRTKVIPFRKGDDLLRVADSRADMGGTNTADAVSHHYRQHSRVIVITDEQAGWGYYSNGDVFAAVPKAVPTFTWNLAGYRVAHSEEGPNRFAFGGLTDNGMDLILPLERGISKNWPWQ